MTSSASRARRCARALSATSQMSWHAALSIFQDRTADRERLAEDAHAMISASGMLGFTHLSELCRDLETNCRSDRDLDASVARFAIARDLARDALARFSVAGETDVGTPPVRKTTQLAG